MAAGLPLAASGDKAPAAGRILWRVELLFPDALPPSEAAGASTPSGPLQLALDGVADSEGTLGALLAPYIAAAPAAAGGGVLVPRSAQELRRRLAPYAGAPWAAGPRAPQAGAARLLFAPPFPRAAAHAHPLGDPLDPSLTLQEALRGRTVVEFPSLLLVLESAAEESSDSE